MQKKIINLSVCLSAMLIFSSCLTTFPILKDNIASNATYKNTRIIAGLLRESDFNEFKILGRQAIVENKELNDDVKRKLAKSLDTLQYEKNQYIFFTIVSYTPFLYNELDFKFKILIKNGTDIYTGHAFIPIKYIVMSQYGSTTSYNYTFVIHVSKPLDVVTKDSPANLRVKFPDKGEQIYKIKL